MSQAAVSLAIVLLAGQIPLAAQGDGQHTHARFNNPRGVATAPDVFGTSLYIADTANNVVRKLDLTAPEPRRGATRH